jgi:hypothetical protein
MKGKIFLASVLIVKDESDYLEEWISYHVMQGFEHFFVYDNRSQDQTAAVLEGFVNHGLVTLISWPKIGAQTDCYRHALRFFGSSVEWMAFTDVDEFLLLKTGETIRDWISHLEMDVSQVKFPWRNFLFSGHMTKPSGLTIENFTKSEPIPADGFNEIRGKPIVRCQDVAQVFVHMCSMASGRTVDPLMRDSSKSISIQKPDFSVGQINHYYYKSISEFRNKIERGQVDGGAEKPFYHPSEELFKGGTDEPMPPDLIDAVRTKISQLRTFDRQPNAYGTFLPNYHSHNITQWKFELSLSHSLAKTPQLRNETIPIPYVKAEWGTVVYDLLDQDIDLRALFNSLHFIDFLRQTKTEVTWLDAGIHLKSSARTKFGSLDKMRKILLFLQLALDHSEINSINSGELDISEAEVDVVIENDQAILLNSKFSFPISTKSVAVFRYVSEKYFEISQKIELGLQTRHCRLVAVGIGLQS